ncbi:MAG: type II toxin-antitoxin system RelE/ParE family toxin [Candidatus Aenigmarchaeota archaeon]|nr:type II toxin-antitoxin system RelE/ParE family toxin [Candidatus Aenigmarchaeota archaeon]
MKFDVKATEIFQQQFDKLSDEYKRQIKKKVELIEQNPFRFKALHSKLYSRVFRIRLNIGGKETRLIYVVLGSKIILVCLLPRSKEYKNLENYLSKIQT